MIYPNYPLYELYAMWAMSVSLLAELTPYFLVISGVLGVAVVIAFLLEIFVKKD
jgi:hypothetical protein